MATPTQVPRNDSSRLHRNGSSRLHRIGSSRLHKNATDTLKNAKPILVKYPDSDQSKTTAMEVAAVSPKKVNRTKSPKVYFYTTPPGKVRIVFLAPDGKAMEQVGDSVPYTLSVGGFYHFHCYFTAHEGAKESTEPVGGTLDVIPHLP